MLTFPNDRKERNDLLENSTQFAIEPPRLVASVPGGRGGGDSINFG